MKRQQSTYARLLKPGQEFWVQGEGSSTARIWKVTRVDVSTREDNTVVTLGDKTAGPLGQIQLVKVYVETRNAPLIFDGTDRVNLAQEGRRVL